MTRLLAARRRTGVRFSPFGVLKALAPVACRRVSQRSSASPFWLKATVDNAKVVGRTAASAFKEFGVHPRDSSCSIATSHWLPQLR